MTITVPTSELIKVLSDALQPASDSLGGIHMATHRAPIGDEPGDVDILSLTSTNTVVLGHTWIQVFGQLQPAVWPTTATKMVVEFCRGASRDKGSSHTVDIDMVQSPDPEGDKEEHPGWEITVSETPALIASDKEFMFHAHPESRFPIRGVRNVLEDRVEPDGDFEESPLTVWTGGVLEILASVAKNRKKAVIQMWRSPVRRSQLVQIGDSWLGAVVPRTPGDDEKPDGPSIEVVLGDAEDYGAPTGAAADWLRNGSGLFLAPGDVAAEPAASVDGPELVAAE